MNRQEILDQVSEINRVAAEYEASRETQKKLNQYCLSVIKARLPKFRYISDFMGGSAGSGWSPSYRVDVNSGPGCYRSGATFHYTSSGEFAWFNNHGCKVYPHERVDGLPDPFDTLELLEKCEELSQELGIPVHLSETTVIHTIPKVPGNVDDVKLIHSQCQIVARGSIEYRGWDCTDQYCVVLSGGKKHLYYGSTGHGGGMNNHLEEGDDLSSFYSFMDETYEWSAGSAKRHYSDILW
jgi:hypothetical protein